MKLLIFLLLLYSGFANAQSDTAIRYAEIVNIDSTSKFDLYDRAKLWVVNGFNDSKNVIQLDNKQEGQILVKGNTSTYYDFQNIMGNHKIFGTLKFTLNILFKDGKYKVEIYDLNFKDQEGHTFGNEITSAKNCPIRIPAIGERKLNSMWSSLKENIDYKCKEIMLSLKLSMFRKINRDF